MRVRLSVMEGNRQSFWMEEIRALCDGGRSLDITVAKRNPTKKTEPIVTKKQPHNCDEELEEEEGEEGDLMLLTMELGISNFHVFLRHTQRWELGWVHQLSPAHNVLRLILSPINFCFVFFFIHLFV